MVEAMDLLKNMKKNGVHPDLRLYNVMINGLCKNGLFTDANELFEKMDGIRCSPDEFTFNIIIQAFLQIKDVKRAVKLVCLMRDKGFAAFNKTISSFEDLLTDPNIGDADKELLKRYFDI